MDRSYTIGPPVPRSVLGQTYIEAADGDKDADGGSASFMSFSANRNVIIYVIHDTQISRKPAWLTTNFLDTGTQVYGSSGSTEPFEVYENIYPANTVITLGSNIPSGWNTQNSSMYTVVAAPASRSTTPPTAPASVQRICATAAVVGLQWTASTDPVGVFAYRITRNGTVIATVSYAQTEYSDTTVRGSTSYRYVVTAVDAAGLATDSRPVKVTTAPASADGDAAYCPSSKITAMTFDYAGAFTETSGHALDSPPYTDGSDLWGVTWGQDGKTYLTFGDGWGLCGEDDTRSEEGNDYTSLGFAVISGPPPSSGCPSRFANIYGGYHSSHPYDGGRAGLLNGKVGPLIAIGSNFYGFGGIWRADNAGGPNDMPNHDEVVYSFGNAYSWVDSLWNFCSASSTGVPNQTGGLRGTVGMCPHGVVNYGAGNSGAPDDYVYLYASANTREYWVPRLPTSPWRTYLLRVPNNEVTTESAYRYYSGLDDNGDPIWTSRISQAQPVFVDRNAPIESQQHPGYSFSMAMALNSVVYDKPLGRYIALAQGLKVGQVAFYESTKPWGPWSVIFYDNIDPATGTGGWGHLGAGTWNGSAYIGADSLGVNIVNAWTSSDGTRVWMTFSSDGLAPADANFPGLAGNELDSLNVVEATLKASREARLRHRRRSAIRAPRR